MSGKKTIFEIFKEKENDFDTSLPANHWHKLESRLDKNQPKKGLIVNFRRWSIAASILVLVGAAIYMFNWANRFTQNAELTASNFDSRVTIIEHLDIADLSDSKFQKEMDFNRAYRARFTSGSFSNDIVERENQTAVLQPRLRLNEKPGKPTGELLPDAMIADLKEDIFENKNKKISPSNMADSELAKSDSKNNEMNSTHLKSSTVSKKLKSNNDLSSFEWLVGHWQQKIDGKESIEKWVKTNSKSIVGNGFLLQGDDSIFTEKIVLKEIAGSVFLFQNNLTANGESPFQLASSNDSQWIFTSADYEASSNQKIIFTKKKTNKLSVDYLNFPSTYNAVLNQRSLNFEHNGFRRNLNKIN